MFFSRATAVNPVQSFNLTVSSGGEDKAVAFGPGSIINGSVVLTLNRPVSAHSIRVCFRCEEQHGTKDVVSIFEVDADVWGIEREAGAPHELSQDRHMFLFAIRLPYVNYPPSLHDTYIGHHISYTLQGLLDLDMQGDVPTCIETARVPVMYLPLVTCIPLDGTMGPPKKTQTFHRNDALIEVTGELIKPAYCPGDLCTVKLTTNNQSDCKITHIDLSLLCTITTKEDDTFKNKHHTLYTESFYLAIPKEKKGHQSVLQFRIPSHCVPTTQNHIGRHLDITYEVVISVPLSGGSIGHDQVTGIWPFSYSSPAFTNVVALPVTIATVPNSYPVPAPLQNLKSYSEQPELPSFIPNIESPMPSPYMTDRFPSDIDRMSVSPSGSFLDTSSVDDSFPTLQDATGHLMVPSSPLVDRFSMESRENRRKSTGSTSSAVSSHGLGIKPPLAVQ